MDAALKFCVIGYHQKVQWRIQLHSGANARMDDRLPRGKGMGRIRVSDLVAIQKRIERVGRVQMGNTPQQLWRSVGAAFEQRLWFVTGHGSSQVLPPFARPAACQASAASGLSARKPTVLPLP